MDKRLDFIDIVKFVLAMLIVFLHAKPFSNELNMLFYPLLRIAVPVFFILSGYFFFKNCIDKSFDEQYCILKIFCIKNINLYFGWFILLLPVTLVARNYFKFGVANGLKEIITAIFFGSTFYASWFLSALVLGVCIVFFISKFLGDKVVIIVSFVAYILCCFSSNYYLGLSDEIQTLLNIIYPKNNDMYNGFLAGLLWIVIGKFIAIHKSFIHYLKFEGVKLYLSIFVSIICLYIEQYVIYYFKLSKANDCYFMLIPTAFFIVISLLQFNIKIKYANYLRDISVVMYCIHLSLIRFFLYVSKKYLVLQDTITTRIYIYIIVVILCILIAMCIFKMRKVKHLEFLKALY